MTDKRNESDESVISIFEYAPEILGSQYDALVDQFLTGQINEAEYIASFQALVAITNDSRTLDRRRGGRTSL